MSAGGRPRFRVRLRTLLLLITVAVVAWSISSYWTDYRDRAERRARELLSPQVGAKCTVIFRPEELGTKHALLKPGEVGGVSNSVYGGFVQHNDKWIVLETGEEQLWIPRERVFLLRVAK